MEYPASLWNNVGLFEHRARTLRRLCGSGLNCMCHLRNFKWDKKNSTLAKGLQNSAEKPNKISNAPRDRRGYIEKATSSIRTSKLLPLQLSRSISRNLHWLVKAFWIGYISVTMYYWWTRFSRLQRGELPCVGLPECALRRAFQREQKISIRTDFCFFKT